MPQTRQETFFNFTVTDKEGKATSFDYKSEKQYEEAKADAAKDGATITVDKQQSFQITEASNIDEILAVVPNEEVALSYFNYGLTLAQHNVKRDLMRDAEWPGVEGVYDLIADVQQPKEKRVADPLSAAKRALKAAWAKVNPGASMPTDEEIAAVLSQFTAAAAAPAQQ